MPAGMSQAHPHVWACITFDSGQESSFPEPSEVLRAPWPLNPHPLRKKGTWEPGGAAPPALCFSASPFPSPTLALASERHCGLRREAGLQSVEENRKKYRFWVVGKRVHGVSLSRTRQRSACREVCRSKWKPWKLESRAAAPPKLSVTVAGLCLELGEGQPCHLTVPVCSDCGTAQLRERASFFQKMSQRRTDSPASLWPYHCLLCMTYSQRRAECFRHHVSSTSIARRWVGGSLFCGDALFQGRNEIWSTAGRGL